MKGRRNLAERQGRVRPCQLRELRGDGLAGAAPRGEEVDDDGGVVLEARVELRLGGQVGRACGAATGTQRQKNWAPNYPWPTPPLVHMLL